MPGTLASGNSIGRFAIDSLTESLSQMQLSHVGPYERSGFTNQAGSEVYPIIGNMGPHNTSSMGNLVHGANSGRSLNPGGTLSTPVLTPRLNLADNGGYGEMSVHGSGRLMGGLLSQGNFNFAAGGLLSRNQVQSGNNHLTSAALLNKLVSHDNTPDIIDFPHLTAHPKSTSGSLGQPGIPWKQNVGDFQKNQELSIQNDDFPALPTLRDWCLAGFACEAKGITHPLLDWNVSPDWCLAGFACEAKGNDTEYRLDFHQKEQFSDNNLSMMQNQSLPMGRSVGYNLGEPYPSHHPQQHASLVQSIGPSTDGLRHINSSNTVPGVGPYDQLIQQYEQLQGQSLLHLRQPLAVNSYRDGDPKPRHAPLVIADRFGLLGLLSVVKRASMDLDSLALGIDLTTLGLNLNSSGDLHKTFASPWAEEPTKGELEYKIPDCFHAKQPPMLHQGYFSKFKPKTLFYIFYSMPKEEAQLYAANELNSRGWFYHKTLLLWLIRDANTKPLVKTDTYERGTYHCFNPNTWSTIRKDNFVLQYEMIEKRPTLPQH